MKLVPVDEIANLTPRATRECRPRRNAMTRAAFRMLQTGCRASHSLRVASRRVLLALTALALAGCVTLTSEPRAVLRTPDGNIRVQRLACIEGAKAAKQEAKGAPALDPARIRVLTWNIHKQGDEGWQKDLAALAADNDVLLLQEVVLEPNIREIAESAGLSWVVASSFMQEYDTGVMTASRIPPLAMCTERVTEPLLRLPKSSVIAWYALAGRDDTLAIVNMHAINFTLTIGAYNTQLAAVRENLEQHEGPIIFAGDLNTWNGLREEAVQSTAAALGLAEVRLDEDHRRIFLGRHLDHIFVRGLGIDGAWARQVTSSDHNPMYATLHVTAPRR
jgi:endonuclease/exonuclease/phosphatase (EEP) superfamily protein YafD